MEQAPFFHETTEAGIERQAFHFVGSEPAEVVAFGAHGRFGVFWRDEDVAQIEVFMHWLRAVRGNLVDIEIEWSVGGDDQPGEAGFLFGFTARDAEDVFVAVAMAAEL